MIFRELTYLSVVCRILTSVFIGGIIGLERGLKNRPAGFRTYMLVCMGSCLIMLTNQYIYQYTGTGDPVRLGAQVVSGIGFLGAGTIIVTKHNQIKGLTTAAGLWAAAGVGLAVGVGFYEGAVSAGIIIYIILTLLHRMDARMHQMTRSLIIYVELTASLGGFIRQIRELGLEISDLQFERENALENGSISFVATLKSKKSQEHFPLLDRIRSLEGVGYLEEL